MGGGGDIIKSEIGHCSEFTKLMFQKNDCFQSSMCYSKNSHVRAQWFTNLLIILIPQQNLFSQVIDSLTKEYYFEIRNLY